MKQARVTALELRSALHYPGCPVCRVKEQSVHRHLFGLLWENVNNMGARIVLAGSLGYCPRHTWQLYDLAGTFFSREAGIAIIYQDLARHVAHRLRRAGACAPEAAGKPRWWQRGWKWLRTAVGLRPSKSTSPTRSCPACTHGDACEERNLEWLVEGCLDAPFRALYEASDGLCLPHLRQALAMAERAHPDVARYLACATVERLEGLAGALDAYARKHAWEYRHEPVTEEEQSSVYRISQFLGGLDWHELELSQANPVPQRWTRDRLKQMGLRIDE